MRAPAHVSLNRAYLALVVAMLAGTNIFAQHMGIPTDTLARVGTSVITARDFLERFELMPFPGKEAQHDSAKIKALRSMVAEKLLAQDAAVRGLNRDSASLRRTSSLERLMVRDELFKREVTAKITVSDRELSTGMRRYPYDMHVLFFPNRTAKLAAELRDSLVRYPSVDSALKRISLRLIPVVDTLVITFGISDWTLEDSAYALSATRRISRPVKSAYLGWGIVCLLEQRINNDASSKSVPDRIHDVQSILKQRKMDERAGKYQGKVLSPQRANVDSVAFERVGRYLHSRMVADSSARASKGGYRLSPVDIDSLEDAFAGSLDNAFVHIPSGAMTLRNICDAARSREIGFPRLDIESFLGSLNAVFKSLVAAELLAREGYHQHLQNTDAVRHDVAVWDDYWLAATLIRNIKDSVTVTDEDVMSFLVTQGAVLGSPYEVNVREVLCDSLSTAFSVLQRALAGEHLGPIARTLSRRPGWSARDGESGYFSVSAYPALGFPALFQDTGTVGGPVRVSDGYSVFTTLGKRSTNPNGAMHLDSLKYFGTAGARVVKQEQKVEAAVSALAERAGVHLYLDRLSRLQATTTNMFTRRFIGFGGAVTAVPTIIPMWTWKGEQKEGVLP